MEKKLIKFINLEKSKFDEFVQSGELQLREAHLIPNFKPGDEVALASVLLSSVRLIKEFKKMILSDIKMMKKGHIYAYNEIVFSKFPKSRIDGLLLAVQGGVIKDAALFEMKNGSNDLDKDQVERYLNIAQSYSIPKLVTVSNQFVSEPTQSPVDTKTIKNVELFHFSWSYLLTLAQILLFDNELNIKDKDQIELMKEVVSYFEFDKSGVCGFNQMKSGWKEVVEKINSGTRIKNDEPNLNDTIVSWQQEEQDLALILSRKLGVLVNSGESKYRGNLKARVDNDKKVLIGEKSLSSNLKVSGAVSDIKIKALFEKRIVEMSVTLKVPQDKKLRGQLNWVKRQIETCKKKNEQTFRKLQNEVLVEIILKNTNKTERVNIDNIDNIYEEIKDREIKEFKILYIKDFGKSFANCRKFVETLENMLLDYYSCVIQYLSNWTQPAPKIVEEKKEKKIETSEERNIINNKQEKE